MDFYPKHSEGNGSVVFKPLQTEGRDYYRRCVSQAVLRPKVWYTETWNYINIYDCVSFLDEQGKEVNLYNRMGYDQLTTRLYTDTIRYVGGGKVKHYHIDDPDITNDYMNNGR